MKTNFVLIQVVSRKETYLCARLSLTCVVVLTECVCCEWCSFLNIFLRVLTKQLFWLVFVWTLMFLDDFCFEFGWLSAVSSESRMFSDEVCFWMVYILLPSPWVLEGHNAARASPICWMREFMYFFGVGFARRLYRLSLGVDARVVLFAWGTVSIVRLVLLCETAGLSLLWFWSPSRTRVQGILSTWSSMVSISACGVLANACLCLTGGVAFVWCPTGNNLWFVDVRTQWSLHLVVDLSHSFLWFFVTRFFF